MAKKFPDLTGDGKVTYADILKGRDVFNSGKEVDVEKLQEQYIRSLLADQMIRQRPDETEAEARFRQRQIQQQLDSFGGSIVRKISQQVDAERDAMAMGSLMVAPERKAYGKGKLVAQLVDFFKSKKPDSPRVEEGQNIDDESFEEMLTTPNKDALSFSKTELNNLKKEVPEADAYSEMIAEFAMIREIDDEIIRKGEALGYDRKKIKSILEGKQSDIDKLRVEFNELTEEQLQKAEDNAARDARAMGSLMMPVERQQKGKGSKIIDIFERLVEPKTVAKKKKMVDEEQALREIQKTVDKDPQALEMLSDDDYMEVVSRLPQKQRANFGIDDAPQDDIVEMALQMEPEEVAQNLQLFPSMEDMFEYAGALNAKDARKFMNALTPEDKEIFAGELPEFELGPREVKGHGGSSGIAILMPAEYEEPPKDTYNNVSTEEEKEQVENMNSDGEMEEEYIDYVADEVLSQEEQDYLFKALDKDDKLEKILDKVMLNATEFTGAGEVDGPGTGVSDSIPARLSDGEFVFTRKATDQIGADKLQKMMDDAEREFDQRKGKANGGETNMDSLINPEETADPLDRFGMQKDDEREIESLMLNSSRMPSLMNR